MLIFKNMQLNIKFENYNAKKSQGKTDESKYSTDESYQFHQLDASEASLLINHCSNLLTVFSSKKS